MIKRVLYNGITWIDITDPSSEEVAQVAHEFNLHPLVTSELLAPSLRPKLDIHDAYLYFVLHFKDNVEVDFVLGEEFLITTRYSEVEPVVRLTRSLAIGDQTYDEYFHAGILFHYIVRALYDDMNMHLDKVRVHLAELEEAVYENPDPHTQHKHVLELATIGKALLDTELAIDPHKEVLGSFERHAPNLFGEHFRRYASALLGHYHSTNHHLHRLEKLLAELREVNIALLTTKQNDIMQIFTILAFFTFPTSLIAAIFGMNTVHMPFIGTPYDFWIVLALIIAASVGMFSFFRHKKWL